MKKQLIMAVSGLIFAICLSSCDEATDKKNIVKGDGDIKTIQRVLPSFDKIQVSGNFLVNITSNMPADLSIRTDSNIEPFITTSVENSSLNIAYKSGKNISPSNFPKIEITTKNLSSLNVSGSTIVNAKNIDAGTFSITAAGSNETTVSGKSTTLNINASGGTEINAKFLAADNAVLISRGTTNVKINAKKNLSIDISGKGNIQYFGNPIITQKTSGSSSISSGK